MDNCDMEYIDIYSELETTSNNLLTAALSGRYCGTVAPHVRISLHNVITIVFHSKIARNALNVKIEGTYEFFSESQYIPGVKISDLKHCAFLIDSKKKKEGSILSSTYPGVYPNNFRCIYLFKGNTGERIKLFFRDFDVYFGGEHCPYDSLTVYEGSTIRHNIIKKICGLQQRLELFSFGSTLLLEFNTSEVAKSNRGFLIDYKFSKNYVNIKRLIRNQRGVSHILGTECDIQILSNRESVHYIESPNFPKIYPPSTTCTYILDGLQGDQNLEKVKLTFEKFFLVDNYENWTVGKNQSLITQNSLILTTNSDSFSSSDECSSGSFVGIALTADSVKTVLSSTEESVYDVILCKQIKEGSLDFGPYISLGPRIVVVFGTVDFNLNKIVQIDKQDYGFKAKIEFKTDFGVPGEAMGDSNKCMFQFKEKRGSFNSPRYPANYPLDTNCTYIIKGEIGEEIFLYFTQFALFEEYSKNSCNDFLEIYDVFYNSNGEKQINLQAKHCWTMFPGPTISTFNSHEMRVVFNSDSFGTANGFNAMYRIQKSRKEDVPKTPGLDLNHCGQLIEVKNDITTGYFTSPGYPVKYNKGLVCDWEIRAREGHQVLLQLNKMDVEGEMTDQKTLCMSAVIVIFLNYKNRQADLAFCGTNSAVFPPIITLNNTIRISFLTSPDKVNGLTGFNFTWTEVRTVKRDSECADEKHYLCSYTRLCISSSLRCNGDKNCGKNDDTDEAHCNIAEKVTDMRTILIAATFSGFIFLFIFGFFCFLFKKKLERKKKRKKRVQRRNATLNSTNYSNKTATINSNLLQSNRIRSGGRPTVYLKNKLQEHKKYNNKQLQQVHNVKIKKNKKISQSTIFNLNNFVKFPALISPKNNALNQNLIQSNKNSIIFVKPDVKKIYESKLEDKMLVCF